MYFYFSKYCRGLGEWEHFFDQMSPRWKMNTDSCGKVDRHEDSWTARHSLCGLPGKSITRVDINYDANWLLDCPVGSFFPVCCQFMGDFQWHVWHPWVLWSDSGIVQGNQVWRGQKISWWSFVVVEQVSPSAVLHHNLLCESTDLHRGQWYLLWGRYSWRDTAFSKQG